MAKKEEIIEKREKIIPQVPQEGMKMEKVFIENFVSLQKVMTNLAIKFDNLSGQISKLLELFEISAKTLAEKGIGEDNKKITEKLDSLLEQNKIFAKGLALLHEKDSVPHYGFVPQMQPRPMQPPVKNPKFRNMG